MAKLMRNGTSGGIQAEASFNDALGFVALMFNWTSHSLLSERKVDNPHGT